jgi:phytoene synthase
MAYADHITHTPAIGNPAMTPDEYCQQQAGASGSSFYYSFLSLPPAQRRGITALYAFCREVDDVVDECSDPQIARVKLAWWREEIRNTFLDKPSHPVTRALLPALHAYTLPQALFQELIDGMEMDLQPARYARFDDLSLYCHRVASVVGMLSAGIFGYRHARTLDFARHLGLALQLTNIIRDVGEDARRNRIYLPAEDLQRFQVSAADILNGRESDALYALMAFQTERAERYYRQAQDLLPAEDRRAQLPSLVMAEIYHANLAEIRADGFHVLHHKTVLPPLRKLWIAWKTRRRERRHAHQVTAGA